VNGDSDRITVVDLATGAHQQWPDLPLMNPDGPPRFSADGRYLALGFTRSGRQEGTIRVWDLTTGKKVHELSSLHTDRAEATLSPDAKWLASWGYVRDSRDQDRNGIIQIWDVASEKEVRRIDIGRHRVFCATFSPDGKHLAVILPERRIGIWEVATGNRVRQFAARSDTMPPLVYSPDGKTLAAGSQEGGVQLWDLNTGKRLGVVRGPKCRLTSLSLRDNGRGLAAGIDQQTVYVWELPTGKLRTPLTGHKAAITSLAFLEGGKRLCSAGEDGLCWWDIASGKQIDHSAYPPQDRYVMRRFFSSFFLSPGGHYLAGLSDRDATVGFLDPKTMLELFSVLTRTRNYGRPPACCSLNDRFALVRDVYEKGTRGIFLTVWDLATGESVRDIEVGSVKDAVCALSPDGRRVALANNADNPTPGAIPSLTIAVWEVATGKQIASVGSGAGRVRNMAFAPDGKSLLVVRQSGSVWVWYPGSDEPVGKLEQVPVYPVSNIAFSPDGRTFALGGTNRKTHAGEVAVWEVATGKPRTRYRGLRGPVYGLAFSPDGRFLASGGADTTILLWDLLRRPDGKPAREEKLLAKDLEGVWKQLHDPDPARGHRALLRLLADPEQAVALFSRRLEPEGMNALTKKEVARLIADLDADTFAKRERAAKALAKAGKQVEAALKAALDSRPSLEKHRRLEELLKRLAGGRRAPERVGPRRALEVLERLGTPAAQRLLETLSEARPHTWLAEEAADSLRRLRARR
jgi:WD40 repeat protein